MSNLSNQRMRQIEAEMSRFEMELLESTGPAIAGTTQSRLPPPPPPPPGPSPLFLPPQLRARLPQGAAVAPPMRLPSSSVQTAAAAAKSAAAAAAPLKVFMDDFPASSKMIYSAPPQLLKAPSPPPAPRPAPVITKNLIQSIDKIKKKKKKDEIAAAMNDGAGTSKVPDINDIPPPPPPPVKVHAQAKRPSKPPGSNVPKKKRFIRTSAGSTWEDLSLQEWDSDDFRIFAGDLGNEVSDEVLQRAFSKYPSFLRSKVVRDRRTGKTRGYGFVSFKDPSDFMRAMREMQGKYVGNRPIKLRKSSWRDRQVEVVRKKDKEKKKLGVKI